MRPERGLLGGLAALLLLAPAQAQIASQAPPEPSSVGLTLHELVARYVAWRGGFAYQSLQTVHERLYLDTAAGRAPGALWMDRDGRRREEQDGAAGKQVRVAGPDGAWSTDAGALDAKLAVERARRLALIEFGDALEGRGGATAALGGVAQQWDRSWSVVRVSFGDADAYDVLLDPITGALCCYMITEGGARRTVLVGEWRLVDGVRMPFAELDKAAAETGLKVSAVELNRPLDPSLFAKPAG